MTVDPDYFANDGGTLTPRTWNQLRQVATGYADSVTKKYPPTTSGSGYNDSLHDVTVAWTNDSPIDQKVYGMVTRGGCQVTLQARSRGYLLSQHGYTLTPGGVPTLTDVSKVGTGADLGGAGIFNVAYAQAEYRQNSVTMPFLPDRAEWITVEPGETITARVAVRFTSDQWETTATDGGAAFTQSLIVSGDTQIDLFALPARAVPAQGRVVPTVVGESHASGIGSILDASVTVEAVPGVQPGDDLIALVVNQFDYGSKITAPPGWTLSCSNGLGDWFANDVHLAIFTKRVTANEPGSYTFGNGFAAEQYVSLIAVRDASPLLAEWNFASQMTRPQIWESSSTAQKVPQIDGDGQLLIALAYVAHVTWQTITETPPAALTPLSAFSGQASSFAAGYLKNPSRPTPELVFTASQTPQFGGHSLTAALLIPGRWA